MVMPTKKPARRSGSGSGRVTTNTIQSYTQDWSSEVGAEIFVHGTWWKDATAMERKNWHRCVVKEYDQSHKFTSSAATQRGRSCWRLQIAMSRTKAIATSGVSCREIRGTSR